MPWRSLGSTDGPEVPLIEPPLGSFRWEALTCPYSLGPICLSALGSQYLHGFPYPSMVPAVPGSLQVILTGYLA